MADQRSDPQLIQACLAGDGTAWQALVARYERLIYSVALSHGLSESDAQDVLQTVFVILLDKLDTCRRRDRLGCWLTTIARREAWRLARRQRPATHLADDGAQQPAPDPVPDALLEEREAQDQIRGALSTLGERRQRLMEYLYYAPEPLSYAEIARLMPMPEGSIGPTRARCLARLRGILQSMGYGHPR
ncbi:MAG: RNA polymerase sigma factor [Anaerolineae bacterium]